MVSLSRNRDIAKTEALSALKAGQDDTAKACIREALGLLEGLWVAKILPAGFFCMDIEMCYFEKKVQEYIYIFVIP